MTKRRELVMEGIGTPLPHCIPPYPTRNMIPNFATISNVANCKQIQWGRMNGKEKGAGWYLLSQFCHSSMAGTMVVLHEKIPTHHHPPGNIDRPGCVKNCKHEEWFWTRGRFNFDPNTHCSLRRSAIKIYDIGSYDDQENVISKVGMGGGVWLFVVNMSSSCK